ncbi:methyl-accepting chemotaxis receptor/sensory transducer [Erythrobacter sp. NAP1]|uniref:methyl-accepting chemotaxis protein n=1 Tax=Erythrobacter sp. NAP1 TaxID=237727 RepID=UPI0000687849|nr:methyl-accepting chemotaxis protein [Erythrobacter sp. NAP1]EAQ29088.1 methyl-accepting chemotaxis receptor/sensory transducer [Erythrobacter sp. NAP1]
MSALQEIAVDLEAERITANHTTASKPRTVFGSFGERFEALSIGRKISTFYGFNLVLALFAGLVLIGFFVELGNRAEQINVSHDLAIDAERLVTDMSEAQRHAEMLVTTGDASRANESLARITIADAKLDDLRDATAGQDMEATDRIGLIAASIEDFRRQIGRFNPDAATASREAQASEVTATGSAALEAARDLAARMGTEADRMSDSGASLLSTLLLIWVALAVLLVLTTLIAQRYFDRSVGGTIKQLANQMTRLAKGEKEIDIHGEDRTDEVGDMARAMSIFHKAGIRLERLSRERSQKAKAELEEQTRLQIQQEEARLERERTLQSFADQFERTVGDVVGGVASASSQLQTTSTAMAASAEQSSNRTAEVATAMEEANTGATAAAAASDEFAMSIGEISRQAASSAELARKATLSANEADSTISELANSAEQVGQIVELIQTIAQRTNLLALNASIEAARGGEAGRGFAVVASEVKELAMQTSRATEQVAEQIRTMQDTTGASVNALRSIANEVAQLETTAVSIASAVDQQSVAGQDLARSIDLAARGTEQVSGHIKEVRELSISTGAAASQVLTSATALEQQAQTLRVQVDGFLAKVRVG